MVKVFIRIIIFFVVVILLNFAAKEIVESSFDLDTMPEVKAKFEVLKNENFNTILVGSSRTFTSINPQYLANLQIDNEPVKAYNLGISALFFPNSYFFIDKLTETIRPKPKLLLVELSYDDRFLLANFNSLMNEPYFQIYKELNLEEFYRFLKVRLKTILEWPQKSMPNQYKNTEEGFISMDKRAEFFYDHIIQHQYYLKNEITKTSDHDPRISDFENSGNSTESRLLKIYLYSLIKKSTQSNYRIFFFLPNRISPTNRKILLPAYRNLPDSLKFNPNLNPQFGQLMSPELSWDLSHLNERGSKIYSQLFAEEFKKQIIDKGYLKN
ncbi:MAG: hypothetical protein V4683_19720 [Bacteroidota bacterium]